MKRFVLKLLVILLPYAVLFVSAEYLLRQIPNDYSYKKSYLDKHSNEIQILIFGASNTYSGINPDYFSQKAFNASQVSQSLNFDFEILKKYQNHLNELKVIVLSISFSTFWERLENSVESWRVTKYTLYYKIHSNSLTNHSELLSNAYWTNKNRLMKYYLKRENNITCNSLGWGTGFKTENERYVDETIHIINQRRTVDDLYAEKNTDIFEKNLKVLHSFVEFCEQNDVLLIFLTTPYYRPFLEKLNTEQIHKVTETMNNFVKEQSNCYYINWSDHEDFVAEDFYDADHLNTTGAEKLSKKLSCYIESSGMMK